MSILLTLREDEYGEIQCPHCKTKFSPEWSTDCGCPNLGEEKESCPKCGQEFILCVYIKYNTL